MSWTTNRASHRSRRIFFDAGAYSAAANRRHAHHDSARATLSQLVAERRRLFTTNFVLAKMHALLLNRVNREVAATVLFQIDESAVTTVVRVSAADEARARQIIRQYQDKNLSPTDATSFAVMERLGIAQAFSFDNYFRRYGFTLVPSTR